MSLIVKICGLSTPDTLEAALEAGTDMVGFVFFPPSPRHIGIDAIAGLAGAARGRAEITVLTVDASDGDLAAIAERVRPDWLQLHGVEPADRIAALKASFGGRVMKALPVAGRDDLARIPRYADVADRLLFDAKPPRDATRPGGLGAAFDWHLLEGIDPSVSFMVSGGLHAGNVAEAVRVTRAGGVDVSSGIERAPGVKDPDMIRDFIRAARAATAPSPLPACGEREQRSRHA
jgi:phosphoribosylanthranilate isomerase